MIAFFLALAALLAPWATLLTLNAVDPISALSVSPWILWNVGVLLAVSALIWSSDWRLGVFCAYVVLNALRAPFLARPWTIADVIVMGALAFTLLREHFEGER